MNRLLSSCASAFLLSLGLSSCAYRDTRHHIIVSVPQQQMALVTGGRLERIYPVSTSKFGLGDIPSSNCTPMGEMEVACKIGDGVPPCGVMKDQRFTGEIVRPDTPGRDAIVSRILWLRGLEPQNANTQSRHIYIHGTAEESKIGSPASYGCVRMRTYDVLDLYNKVGNGAHVTITFAPWQYFIPMAPRS